MSARHIPIVICRNCALYNTARVLGLETPDCSTLDQVVIRNHPIDRGQRLFSAGDPVRYLYLIHSGSCISYEESESPKVMSFFLPGELVGIEDIGESRHSHTAVALENGSLCQLDFTHLETNLSAEELIRVQRQRFQAHGLPALAYRLPMSREEIADYLGLAPETVIRILKKLGSRGLVSIRTRQVEILDPTALERLSAA